MLTQTNTTFVMVSQEAEDVLALGRKHHWRFRIITDFQGVIDGPVFSKKADWLYMPKRAEGEVIIPKAAFRRHAAVTKAGYRVSQVIIGHEVVVAPEEPIAPPMPEREIDSPKPEREIDWGNVADVAARGVVIGMIGLATVPLFALLGAVSLLDPSYCIVLDDGVGTVVELIRWNVEI